PAELGHLDLLGGRGVDVAFPGGPPVEGPQVVGVGGPGTVGDPEPVEPAFEVPGVEVEHVPGFDVAGEGADAVAPVADGAGRDPAASLGGVEPGEELPQRRVCHAYLLCGRAVVEVPVHEHPITWTRRVQMAGPGLCECPGHRPADSRGSDAL